MVTSVSPAAARLRSEMSMIVVSPSTGTSAFGSVSVYGRSLRPAPAASTRPIMGWFLPKMRGVPAEDSGALTFGGEAAGKAPVPPPRPARKYGRAPGHHRKNDIAPARKLAGM